MDNTCLKMQDPQSAPSSTNGGFTQKLRLPSGRTYRWSIDDEDWEEDSEGEADSVSRTASSSQGVDAWA